MDKIRKYGVKIKSWLDENWIKFMSKLKIKDIKILKNRFWYLYKKNKL